MRAQILGMIVVLGAYYGGVIMQLDERRETVEQSGTAVREQKLEDLKSQTGAVKNLKKKLEQREREMAEKYGQLRYLPESEMAPLDTLMDCILKAAKQAGGDIRQVTPIEAVDTGLMSLQGLECTMLLPGEAAFETFLNSMREKYCPLTNEHSMTLTRTRLGVQLEARFTVLRLKKTANNKALSAAGKALETWQHIQRPRGKVLFDALLEARPKPVPSIAAAPPPTKKPAPVASVKPPPTRAPVAVASAPAPVAAPPPPKFSGKLIGLTNIGGKAVALVELGGSQKVFEEGQELEGWKLESIQPDRMILKVGTQRSTVFFVGEEAPEERPASAGAEPGAPARRGGLGLRGKFVTPTGGLNLPKPFDGMRRVFEVTGVEDQTIAGRAGLRTNDRIIAIDQVPLHSTDQVLGLRARVESGKTATVFVERGGSLIPINFTQRSQ